MPRREIKFINGCFFHVFNKGVKSKIFLKESDYERFLEIIKFYSFDLPWKFSQFICLKRYDKNEIYLNLKDKKIVEIIAYNIMDDHFHLILKQVKDHGIQKFMANILHSYTKFFNLKNKRKGPLWEGNFKAVFIENNEDMLSLINYLHIEPVIKGIVKNIDEWRFSSYFECIGKCENRLCNFEDIFRLNPKNYRNVLKNCLFNKNSFSKILHLTIENLDQSRIEKK